jgi:hypothetical protein
MRFRLREINGGLRGGVIVKANLTLYNIPSNRREHRLPDDPFYAKASKGKLFDKFRPAVCQF